MYEFLILSAGLLAVWLIIFLLKNSLKKEILFGSLSTLPFGLTEPLFVPEYWNPSTLFNLAQKTGFDIESFIFCFAVGGIGVVLYEVFVKAKHTTINKKEREKHKLHRLILSSPIIIFLILLFAKLNPIYIASIALFLGALATLYCRHDLKKKIWYNGFLFLLLYSVSFFILTIFYPNFVKETWNFDSISGLLILGIPIEELIWAFTFGMYWASLYEHIFWKKLSYN